MLIKLPLFKWSKYKSLKIVAKAFSLLFDILSRAACSIYF